MVPHSSAWGGSSDGSTGWVPITRVDGLHCVISAWVGPWPKSWPLQAFGGKNKCMRTLSLPHLSLCLSKKFIKILEEWVFQLPGPAEKSNVVRTEENLSDFTINMEATSGLLGLFCQR